MRIVISHFLKNSLRISFFVLNEILTNISIGNTRYTKLVIENILSAGILYKHIVHTANAQRTPITSFGNDYCGQYSPVTSR